MVSRVFTSCGAILIAICIGAAASAQPSTLPDAFLSGRVVDGLGNPVAEARIHLQHWSARDAVGATVSGADGRFRLGPLRMTAFRARWPNCAILVRTEAHAPAVYAVDAVFPGSTLDVGNIRIEAGTKLAGTVVDTEGRPLAGAEIEARHGDGDVVAGWRFLLNAAGVIRGTTSDGEGQFESAPVRPGGLVVVLRADGCATTLRRTWVAPGQPYLDLGKITLRPDVPISGVVVDARGKPIAQAEVRANLILDAWGNLDRATKTNAKGKFTLRGFGSNLESITATAMGYESLRHEFVAGDNAVSRWFSRALSGKAKRTGLRLKLGDAFEIKGKVVDANTGRPIPFGSLREVDLCAVRPDDEGAHLPAAGCTHSSWGQDAETGAAGFTFGIESGGDYYVRVTATGYAPAAVRLPRLDRPKSIAGLVVEMKHLAPADDDPSSNRVAGSLHATDAGKPPPEEAVGWVAARCVKQTGNVNPRRRIVHGCLIPSHWFGLYRTPLRPDGTFAFDHLEPGTWFLTVERARRAPIIHGPVVVEKGKDVDGVKIEDTAAATIRGKVTGAPPEKEGRTWVVAFNDNVFMKAVPTEADGTFVLKELPPGDYAVCVGHDDLSARRRAFLSREGTYNPEALGDPWQRASRVTLRPNGNAELDALAYRPLR